MDRDQFEALLDQYYNIYQYFSQEEITIALIESGLKLSEIKVQNTRCRNQIRDILDEWDAADPEGRQAIESSLVASDGRIIP